MACGNRSSAIIVASATCVASLVPIALYQLGFVSHLPDPRSPLFDSDGITSSAMAHPFGIPDSLLGLGSYGLTLGLSLTPPEKTVMRQALAAKIAFDGVFALTNTVRQIVSFRKLCFWCMGTVAATAALVWNARGLIKHQHSQ